MYHMDSRPALRCTQPYPPLYVRNQLKLHRMWNACIQNSLLETMTYCNYIGVLKGGGPILL